MSLARLDHSLLQNSCHNRIARMMMTVAIVGNDDHVDVLEALITRER